MKEIKELFDKFELDENKTYEIRSELIHGKSSKHIWAIPVAAVAAALVIVMAIPYTRERVVNAAEQIFKQYKVTLSNGDEIAWGTDPDTGKEYYAGSYHGGHYNDCAQVKDDRLYLVVDGEWIDVTDKCSATKYYRYEIVHSDGVKEVIFIGGIPEGHRYGSLVFIYDPDGNYITSDNDIPYDFNGPRRYINCEAEDFEWAKNACHDEGIPCIDHKCEKCYG